MTAQNNYNKLIDTNKVWNFVGCYGPPPYYTTFYKFKQDTSITGTPYYRLLYSTDSVVWHYENMALLREDTINRKVYILSNNTEGLLYDFDLSVGDSVIVFNTGCLGGASITMHLQTIDSVLMQNQTYRKRFHFNYLNYQWIEGIGSPAGLLHPGCFLTGNCEQLVCYYENNNFEYVNPPYNQCFFSHPDDYFKYVDTNKLWNYSNTYAMPPPYYTTLFRFKKDTLINTTMYFIAESTMDSVNWQQWDYFFRQAGKKVYVLHNGAESLVYDFNAMPGDTLHIFHDDMGDPSLCPDTCLIKIMGIDLVNIDGLYRKRTYFQYLNCPNSDDYWIEGIGYRSNILKECFQIIGNPILKMVCYYENDSLKYINPEYGSCYSIFVNTEDTKTPIIKEILIKNLGYGCYAFESDMIIEEIKLYSFTGQDIRTYYPHSCNPDINLIQLSSGMYFIHVKAKNHQSVFKIIKQ